MTMSNRDDFSTLIAQARDGDAEAGERLFAEVYDQLRQIARRSRFVGKDGETMQPTVLVNEAFLSLGKRWPMPPDNEPDNRATFFRTVALAMRTILREHWRSKQALKRGGGEQPLALDEQLTPDHGGEALDRADYLALDSAMDKLERYNHRWHDVVLHRYFAGRTNEETATMLGVGLTTVKTDWQLARAWLHREIMGTE
ncbi:MAG: ECF-type sigma factor [Planctomycetota bacterium]